MKKDLKLKFSHKNHNVEVSPRINPRTKQWFAEYVITENYPEGTRFRGYRNLAKESLGSNILQYLVSFNKLYPRKCLTER